MSLPSFNTNIRELSLMQSAWASQLDPVLANPMVSGLQLKNISLVSGNNTINTTLGRKYQGYIITGMRKGFSQVYETDSTNSKLFLVLNSSAPTTVDIWVF